MIKDTHRYIIPSTVNANFKANMPPHIPFGKIEEGPDGYNIYVLTGSVINKLIKPNVAIDTICQSLYGQQFEPYLEQFKQPQYKVYDLVKIAPHTSHIATDPYVFPYDIDFTIMLKTTLYKKTLPKVQGKPTAVEYYTDYDPQTGVFSNIICRIDFELIYDSIGFIVQRKEKLKFYKEDGSVSTEFKDIGRVYHPIYDAGARIQEGKLRREAIVDDLQIPVLGVLQVVMAGQPIQAVVQAGRDFLARYATDFENFIKASNKTIITSINNAPDPWLEAPFPPAGPGVTVRQYITGQLNTSY